MHAEGSSRHRTAPWSHYAWATAIVGLCVGTDWLMQGAMSESDLVNEGQGIPAEHVEHVFERFYRKAQGRGAGLGLAMCRAIARAHGGDVVAISRAPQRGLCMQLRLPFRAPPMEGIAAVG